MDLKEINVRAWTWVEKSTAQRENGGDRCQEHTYEKELDIFINKKVIRVMGVLRLLHPENIVMGMHEPNFSRVYKL